MVQQSSCTNSWVGSSPGKKNFSFLTFPLEMNTVIKYQHYYAIKSLKKAYKKSKTVLNYSERQALLDMISKYIARATTELFPNDPGDEIAELYDMEIR